MRKITTSIFVLSLALLTFSGCKKDDAPAEVYPAGQGKITGTGDVSFNVTGTNAVFASQSQTGMSAISITGLISNTPTKAISITLVNISSTGTYSLGASSTDQGALVAYVAGNDGTSDNYISSLSTESGTITITSISAASIEGSYTTKASNFLGTTLTFSGTFKGNF